MWRDTYPKLGGAIRVITISRLYLVGANADLGDWD
jgi:hypothetical protein